MESEEQVRAVEMLMSQIGECAEPKEGYIILQEMMNYHGIHTPVGPRQIIPVCEYHLFVFLELVIGKDAVEDFKKWYSIKQQEKKEEAKQLHGKV